MPSNIAMIGKRLSTYKASRILELYALNGLNKTQISKALNISRGTVIKYIYYYEQSDLTYTDLLLYSNKDVIDMVRPKHVRANKQEKSNRLTMLFPAFHERLITGDANIKQVWTEYYKDEPSGYKYSHFVYKYHEWRKINNIKITALPLIEWVTFYRVPPSG